MARGEILVINDRHLVSVAEAAYTGGLGKTFLPNKQPVAAETAAITLDQPVRWWLYSVAVKVVDTNDRYREGIIVQIAAPIPNDTGSIPLAFALQSGDSEYCMAQWPEGLPVDYGLRWRIRAGGIAATDLVIFRATYAAGSERPR